MKTKKPDYIILHEGRPEPLEALVNQAIKEGYKPLGSVVVSHAPGSWATWAQAMVYDEANYKPIPM